MLRTLHAEIRILAVYAKYVAPPTKVNELDGCQNDRTRAAADVSMEKNEKTNVFRDR